MGSFGNDLRNERLIRGVALEQITAVTKISSRHLLALEEERFRLLPGGILNKGIVRSYAGALGLDPNDWTDRFLRAYTSSGQGADEEVGWTAFASNVGRARMQRREATEMRLRWLGAAVLLAAVVVTAIFSVRYYGERAGWWHTKTPNGDSSQTHAAIASPVDHSGN